jgi:hypothetical protein
MSMAASDYLGSDHVRQAGVTSVVHKRQRIPFRVVRRPYSLSAAPPAGLPRFFEKWWPILKAANIKAENIKAE